jgi:hypothetical protein
MVNFLFIGRTSHVYTYNVRIRAAAVKGRAGVLRVKRKRVQAEA